MATFSLRDKSGRVFKTTGSFLEGRRWWLSHGYVIDPRRSNIFGVQEFYKPVAPAPKKPAPIIRPIQKPITPHPITQMNILELQGNRPRPGEPIPVQYGKMLSYPDLVSRHAIEITETSKIGYYLFCLGQGQFQIEEIKIGNQPIADVGGVSYEVIAPGQQVTLFPTFIKSALPANVAISDIYSEQIANDAGTTIDEIKIGIQFLKGLFSADFNAVLSDKSVTFTIQAITIDDNGAETGTWTTLGAPTVTARTVAVVKQTFSYTVSPARYKVRVKRNTPESTDSRAPDAAEWTMLTGSRTDHPGYGDVTLIAVKSVSTSSPLNIKDNKLAVVATRKIKTWNGNWSGFVASSSLVWAMVDAFKSHYGGNMPDSFLDLPALKALDDKLTARGDFFNGRFEEAGALMDAIESMGKAARCRAYIAGGLLNITRDEPVSSYSALFTPQNMSEFKITYRPHEYNDFDHIIAEYIDPDTWQISSVTCTMGGSARPKRLPIFGVTSRAQAWREGMTLLARHLYGRLEMSWITGLEGQIPTINSVCVISHDNYGFGLWGSVVNYISGDKTLVLTNPVNFYAQTVGNIYLSKADGSVEGPLEVKPGASDYEVILTGSPLAFTPVYANDSSQEPTRYAFSTSVSGVRRARIIAISPADEDDIEIKAVVEDDRVYSAENGTMPPKPSRSWSLPVPLESATPGSYQSGGNSGGNTVTDVLSFTNLTINATPGWIPVWEVSWQKSGYDAVWLYVQYPGGGWEAVSVETGNQKKIMFGNLRGAPAQLKAVPYRNGMEYSNAAIIKSPGGQQNIMPDVSGVLAK